MGRGDERAHPEPPTVVDGPRAQVEPESAPTAVHVRASVRHATAARAVTDIAGRYAERVALGKGGMGEVALCYDRAIGRDVALKRILPAHASDATVRARFLREACVQGQLEHPTVVPVYDLGVAPDDAPFFTMKRVQGDTLAAILHRHRDLAPAERQRALRRVLRAFAEVCLGVHFAHEHGVIHRDLKPANLMLGSFGEVYVLDWGLARIVNEAADGDVAELDATVSAKTIPVGARAAEGSGSATEAGTMMGTLGYMAPEQLEAKAIDRRTDVYALGAILFEIASLERLHEGDATKLTESTLQGVDARPSVRVPDSDAPPELDAICVRATALAPDDRYPTAAALAEDIERFLDGDRDIEHRREVARFHAARATDAAKIALARPNAEARVSAVREIGRALALDPHNQTALQLMTELLRRPPQEVPKEARAAVEAVREATVTTCCNAAAALYVLWALGLVPLVAAGIWVDHALAAVLVVVLLLAAGSARGAAQAQGSRRYRLQVCIGVANVIATALASRAFGPLVFVPTMALTTTLVVATLHSVRERRLMALGSLSAIVGPLVLEGVGVLPSSYLFEHGRFVVVPAALRFDDPTLTLGILVGAELAVFATAYWFVAVMRTRLSRLEEETQVRAWHFEQLFPAAADDDDARRS